MLCRRIMEENPAAMEGLLESDWRSSLPSKGAFRNKVSYPVDSVSTLRIKIYHFSKTGGREVGE